MVQAMTLPLVGEVYLTSASGCTEALGILDSGCQRTVMGIFPFMRWETKLREIQVIEEALPRMSTDEIFKFGNNGRLKALFRVEVPVGLYGKQARLDVCVVAGQTPLLVSRATMVKLGLSIDFGNQTVTSAQLAVTSKPLLEHGGHLILDMMNFPQAECAYKADLFQFQTSHEVEGDSLGGDAQHSHHEQHVQSAQPCDEWDWVTPDICRRRHQQLRTSAFCPSTVDGMTLDMFVSLALQIKQTPGGEVRVAQVPVVASLPVCYDLNAWVGETWFWKPHVTKKQLWQWVLHSSAFPLKPRSLRLAWHGDSRAVPQVLGDSRVASVSTQCQGAGDPTLQGSVDRGTGEAAAREPYGDLAQAHVCGRAQGTLEVGTQLYTPSMQSSDSAEQPAEERGEAALFGAWVAGARRDADRHDDATPPSSLGSAMPSIGREGEWQGRGAPAHPIGEEREGGLGACDASDGVAAGSGSASGDCERGGDGPPSFESGGSAPSRPARDPWRFTDAGIGHAQSKGQDGSVRDDQLFRDLFQRHRKTMRRADRIFLTEQLVQYSTLMTAAQTWENSLGRKPRVLEIFAGSMNLSRVAHDRGWEVLQPCDLALGEAGLDLSTRVGQIELERQLREQRPDFVCWAPPCSDYSPLQNILPRDPTKRAHRLMRLIQKRKVSGRLWRFCVRTIRRDQKDPTTQGRIHLVENPWTSKAWELFRVPGHRARVDQCRFGLKVRSDTHRRVMKPTRLQCTHPEVSARLEQTCTCEPKLHDHIISGDRVNGKWIARAQRCGAWPTALCNHILGAVEQSIGVRGSRQEVLVLDTFQENETDNPDETEQHTDAGHSKDQEVAYRLHVKYGHPSNESLARALQLGGARKEIVEAVKRLHCGTCDRVRPPKAPPKVGTQRATSFNQIVGLDIFYVHDCKGAAHKVLSMVDLATTYQVLRLADHRTAQEISSLFFEGWLGVFGPPVECVYDQGTEFMSMFDELLGRLAIHSKIVPVEAHWKGGTTERHGGIVRTILRKMIDHHNVYSSEDLRVVLQEAAAVKNSLSRQSGFSPLQWVLGYDHALPGSVLDRPHDLSVHDRLQSADDGNELIPFAQRMNMRETARKAWHELDNSHRLRRALLSRPKQQREAFLPGERVYFYHMQQAGRAPKSRGDDPTCWHGPGTVVAQQGTSTVWISWRRTLLRVATENVRSATEDEQVGHEL